jgi:hypothetical protein
MKWEYFLDSSYFDMWAVRPVGNRNFYTTMHVPTEEQARNLTELMNSESPWEEENVG